MHLDPDACYQAVESRDPRFDGRFFTGVVSTGVYCRPVCPARTPRRENVRFFACAAAAQRAGFRPCRRCRPETSPGTPAWAGSSATVSRGMRLISEGFLDGAGVENLAAVLGVGARHLRRLFDAHLGASPAAIALTRRVHFARTLLDDTALSVTDVAFASGFSSVRRFNDAFRSVFGTPPSKIRHSSGRTGRGSTRRAALSLRLPYRVPFDFESLIAFMRRRAIPGVEIVRGSYRRFVEIDGACGEIDVAPKPDDGCFRLSVSAELSRVLPGVVERVRRIFDLGADPVRIADHLSRDAALRPLVEANPGLRVPGAWDGFEVAVRAVVGQQIGVSGATTLVGRIAAAYGRRLEGAGNEGPTYAFPTPERLRRARLERVGITGMRARALRALARAVCDGDVDFGRPLGLDDVVQKLSRIDGIGTWTAHYVAMRAFGDPDAFPSGDLGLLRAAGSLFETRGARSLEARAERWRPWRAYAAMHLWDYHARREKGRS